MNLKQKNNTINNNDSYNTVNNGSSNKNLPILNQRLLDQLQDDKLADMSLIGDEGVDVPAFRLVLASMSPVFEKMLYGGFVEARRDSIKFPNTSQRVLQALVHYLITGTVELEETEESDVYRELIQLGTLANVYEIVGLAEPLARTFRQKLRLDPGQVCPLLVEMHELSCPQLYQVALDTIQESPHSALTKRPQTPAITCLPPNLFQELTETEQIQEVFLEFPRFSFERIVEWRFCRDFAQADDLCRTVLKKLNLLALVPKDLEIMVEKGFHFLTQDHIRAMLLEQEFIGTATDCEFGKGLQCSYIKVDNAEDRNANVYFKRVSNNNYIATVPDENGNAMRVFYCADAKQWQICEGKELRFYYPPETTRTYPWLQVNDTDDSSHASGFVSNLQVRCACQRKPSVDHW